MPYNKPWIDMKRGSYAQIEAVQCLVAVRDSLNDLETFIGCIDARALSDKELKRLDKAVTLMKAGLKIAKKAMRERQSVDTAQVTA